MNNLIYLDKKDILNIFNMSNNLNPNVIFINSDKILFLNQTNKKLCLIDNNCFCNDLILFFIRNNDIEKNLNCYNIQYSTIDYLNLILDNCINNNYENIYL